MQAMHTPYGCDTVQGRFWRHQQLSQSSSMRRPASRLVLLACGRHRLVQTPLKLLSYSAVALAPAAAASLALICASML